MDVSLLSNQIQIVTGLISLAVTSFAVYQWAVKPVRKHISNVKAFITKVDLVCVKVDQTLKTTNEVILPFIESFKKEFSVNSGKSIKDQINRIDDGLMLVELRSKLVASNLVATGMMEFDANGNCVWQNKGLCELFGLNPDEMMGNGWLSAIADDERTHVYEKWREHIQYGIPHETVYTVINKKTNQTFKCRSIAMSHKNNSGKLLGYYGSVIKI